MNCRTLRTLAALLALAFSSIVGCISPEEPGALLPPTADEDPALPQRSIMVAGRSLKIHTETFGDPSNPALFMMHDALGDYRAFKPFQALADKYFVVMWDRRGDGLSERITDGYTADTLVEEIDALKSIHSPDQPITLIGHGFGAAYTALYMSRRPANVRQAVLMEPIALNGTVFGSTYYTIWSDSSWNATVARMQWQTEQISPTDHETLDYKALLYVLDSRWSGYYCDSDNPPALPLWRPGGYVEYLRDAMFVAGDGPNDYNYDFAAGLSTFPTKVLFVVGNCSALGATFQKTNNMPLIQHADLEMISGAGHRLFVEKPADVLAAVRAYLEEY